MLIYHFAITFYIHSATTYISVKAYISYSLFNVHNGSARINIHQMSVFLCLMYCIYRTVGYYICLVIRYKCTVQIKKYYHKNHSNKYIIYGAKRFFKSDIINLYCKHCSTDNSRIIEKLCRYNLCLCHMFIKTCIIHIFSYRLNEIVALFTYTSADSNYFGLKNIFYTDNSVCQISLNTQVCTEEK